MTYNLMLGDPFGPSWGGFGTSISVDGFLIDSPFMSSWDKS